MFNYIYVYGIFFCLSEKKCHVNVFQALIPSALYSVFFLVDKDTVAKPERDINVQVNKDSYYQIDSRYFKLKDAFVLWNARPKEINLNSYSVRLWLLVALEQETLLHT